MAGSHAGVEHGDRRTGAVVAARPCLVGLNERYALRQHRQMNLVFEHPYHVGGGLERGERRGANLHRDKRYGLVAVDNAAIGEGKSRRDPAAGRGNLAPLRRDRGESAKPSFGDMAADSASVRPGHGRGRRVRRGREDPPAR